MKLFLFSVLGMLASTSATKGGVRRTQSQANGHRNNCESFQATWVPQQLKPSPFLTVAHAVLCNQVCEQGERDCCLDGSASQNAMGSVYLKEATVGADSSAGLVVDGGYLFNDGDQLLFQGVPSESDHDALGNNNGFFLAITGGTGKYQQATGNIFIANSVPVHPGKPGPVILKPDGSVANAPAQPSRVSTVEVCNVGS